MEKFCEISFCQQAGKNKRRNQDALFNGESVFQYVFKKPETRIETRDSFIIGVADGVYNSIAPAKASKVVMEALSHLKTLNKETVIYLQDKLSEALADHYFGSATTLVAAEINQLERKAKILSVGDSRAYLIAQTSEWEQITEDHSIFSEIIGENANPDDDHYASIYGGVSSCLVADNSEFKEKIFFQEIELKESDTLLLCTDGLTDYVDQNSRKWIWNEYENVLERLSHYQKSVKWRRFSDDMSVISVKI